MYRGNVSAFISRALLFSRHTCRGSLRSVFFPSVTLCNINQGRSSLFAEVGLANNETLLAAVLRQAYLGMEGELDEPTLKVSNELV